VSAFLHQEDTLKLFQILKANLNDIVLRFSKNDIQFIDLHESEVKESSLFPDGEFSIDLVSDYILNNLGGYDKYFLFPSNVMGVTAELFYSMSNLLDMEEDISIILRDSEQRNCGCAFQRYDPLIVRNCFTSSSCDAVYKEPADKFWITINGLISIRTIEDFKSLYAFLSQRDNIIYCDKTYYDQLTEIFIEHKEFL
jgi:hypothetical protein